MDPITDPRLAGERLLTYAREGRLVQSVWHDEEDGREIACLLGAAAGIDDVPQCPASLMPKWTAWALPGLFDGQSKAHAITFAIRWGKAMIHDKWARIDWDAVRREWMAFVVKQAKDAAAAARDAADAAAYAAADADAYAAADAAAYAAVDADAYVDARDAQADALMDAIERAMGVE